MVCSLDEFVLINKEFYQCGFRQNCLMLRDESGHESAVPLFSLPMKVKSVSHITLDRLGGNGLGLRIYFCSTDENRFSRAFSARGTALAYSHAAGLIYVRAPY